MNFAQVLQELELKPLPTEPSDWLDWAKAKAIKLPEALEEGLKLGAAQYLTQYSNDEAFEAPSDVLLFDSGAGVPVLLLLSENQGNYLFGLLLDGSADPPVLLCDHWEHQHGKVVNLRWRPYAHNFADFAFARLFDFQYRWVAEQEGWSDALPVQLPPLDEALEQKLLTYFKRGPTTLEVIALEPSGSRQRFYRAGQRLSFSLVPLLSEEEEPYWEAFCASPESHAELVATLKEVLA